ncbi:MAG: FtsW/RodA/SpoVE family cell cycle protein [Filifactor alocis]|nr:FtsW/RodA/SpoVE family cell cycle protein [Filifactor alocis]
MSARTIKQGKMDRGIFFLVIVLVMIGLVMVYSSSYVRAYYSDENKNMAAFFISNARVGLLGLIVMMVVSFIPYKLYRNIFVIIILCAGVGGLLLLLLLKGSAVNESVRWFKVAGLSVQPSEMAKTIIIFFVASMLSSKKMNINRFWYFIIILSVPSIFTTMILLQPHFSTSLTIFAVTFYMMVLGGTYWRYIIGTGSALLATVGGLIVGKDYARQRVLSLFSPELTDGKAYNQVANALGAISSGGLFGRGLGRSVQKYLYLAASYNDMIFAIYAEEFGFFGALILILIFFVLIVRCMRLSKVAPDKFGSLLVAGITAQIAFQFAVNIGVTLGILPTTGVPLPFISFGGSALLTTMASMGIVLNVSRYATGVKRDQAMQRKEGGQV